MECVSSTSFSLNINGTLHGYFKGKHGLRQGDPLSPYLFTLIMEVFTLMLQRRASESNLFMYHRYCDKLNLINLCFADDLFVFVHGDANSARVTMACLDEFKDVSGLVPSLPMSTAYFCNVLNHTKLAILNIIPFKEGRFPVKYLGVPLISSRLVYSDCKELIEKVPSRFLWCQGDMRKGKAKVPWEVVCLPRNERGLGIRKLDMFNKALMVSHIWNLLSLKESLWVKWIHFIWYKAGNGATTFTWFDRWSSVGPLSEIISARDIHRTGHLGVSQPWTVANVWDTIRPHGDEISWCDVVWNHMKLYAGLPQVAPSLNSIVD
ncbi:putative reverse transcriptase domain, reverse transcriptase zinc-binding domain protein [Tanacetum coccineum]